MSISRSASAAKSRSASRDMPVVVAHKLVPERLSPNAEYLSGRFGLARPRIALDCAEAGRVLGWRPRADLAGGLARTWAWASQEVAPLEGSGEPQRGVPR